MTDKSINKTAGKLVLVAIAMFGFGYALVPLYNVYCDWTGRGSNVAVSEASVSEGEVDEGRLVTVVFDTNTRDIPWTFKAKAHRAKVQPGVLSEALFVVENTSLKPVVGRAIPSVSPVQAGVYFSKTECFCFREQLLAPGERKEMLVRFVVDVGLPERFASLTLSYTFFAVPDPETVAQKDALRGKDKHS